MAAVSRPTEAGSGQGPVATAETASGTSRKKTSAFASTSYTWRVDPVPITSTSRSE
jgi:hypothetical protein